MNFKEYDKIVKDCRKISEAKNSDYNQVIDAIELGGIEGIAVRLIDKVARVNSLTRGHNGQKVKDESVRDTFMDIINYAIYGVMLLDGTWGDKELNADESNPITRKIRDHNSKIRDSSPSLAQLGTDKS